MTSWICWAMWRISLVRTISAMTLKRSLTTRAVKRALTREIYHSHQSFPLSILVRSPHSALNSAHQDPDFSAADTILASSIPESLTPPVPKIPPTVDPLATAPAKGPDEEALRSTMAAALRGGDSSDSESSSVASPLPVRTPPVSQPVVPLAAAQTPRGGGGALPKAAAQKAPGPGSAVSRALPPPVRLDAPQRHAEGMAGGGSASPPLPWAQVETREARSLSVALLSVEASPPPQVEACTPSPPPHMGPEPGAPRLGRGRGERAGSCLALAGGVSHALGGLC
jgi:hypothetical protein